MMINTLLSETVQASQQMGRLAAEHIMRPISRTYDRTEHQQATELEVLNEASRKRRDDKKNDPEEGLDSNSDQQERSLKMIALIEQLCWGDTGLFLARPGSGLGNAAIMAVGTPEQKATFGKRFAAMAITEPGTGSDSKNISTTAVRDGDAWLLNGEKIYVTDGAFCDCVVVWATLDKSLGKAAIKSFIVEKDNPGLTVARLEKKLGIRASDTATLLLQDCRVPADALLGGNAEVATDAGAAKKAFGGVMQTFDNTRPIVAAMALGCAQAALDLMRELLAEQGVLADYSRARFNSSALEAEIYSMESELAAARMLTYKAAWMMDQRQPNSVNASMAKAKAGRVGNSITLRCVELCQGHGYSEEYLLEKFSRDSKILDIFEGTQQIQQLIIARHLLHKSSAELK